MSDRQSDDMGNDEQLNEIELAERYVEDPPEDDTVIDIDDGELTVDEYLASERRPGEPDDEPRRDWDGDTATDESSFHVVDDQDDEPR